MSSPEQPNPLEIAQRNVRTLYAALAMRNTFQPIDAAPDNPQRTTMQIYEEMQETLGALSVNETIL